MVPMSFRNSILFLPEFIFFIMLYRIDYIEFDFDGEDEMDAYDKDRLTSEYIGEVWEADDEDDLVEELTCASGWCIKSIDYSHVLS